MEAQNTAPTIVGRAVTFDFAGTQQEKRSFEYFRTCTAPELGGYFSDEFWKCNVLRASFSEPALRHAVIALGSLHENFSKHSSIGTLLSKDSPSYFAVRSHMKAVSCLGKSLKEAHFDVNAALMACIIFISFDSLVGEFDSAIIHLRHALRILEDHRDDPKVDSAALNRIITRLGLQAIFFVDAQSNLESSMIWELSKPEPLPKQKQFESLNQARHLLNSIIDNMTHFFYSSPEAVVNETAAALGQDYHMSLHGLNTKRRKPQPELLPTELLTKQLEYAKQLRDWTESFDAYLQTCSRPLSNTFRRGAMLLKVHSRTASCIVHSSLARCSVQPQKLDMNTEFQQIMNMCCSLVQAEVAGTRSIFSAELGILAPVYYVALNSHNLSLRRTALQILSTPRREGMWDSRIASSVIEKVMHLEAQGLDPNPSLTDPLLRWTTESDAFGIDSYLGLLMTPRRAAEIAKIGNPDLPAKGPLVTDLIPWTDDKALLDYRTATAWQSVREQM